MAHYLGHIIYPLALILPITYTCTLGEIIALRSSHYFVHQLNSETNHQ
jgi:hypothetical protein